VSKLWSSEMWHPIRP